MTRVVLVMHEPLGAAFASCVTHVLGAAQAKLSVFDVPPDGDVTALSQALCHLLRNDPHTDCLVLCDLVGATPYNIAQHATTQLKQQGKAVCVLAGANLNMVLKALTDRQPDILALRASVSRSAMRGIVAAEPDSTRFTE